MLEAARKKIEAAERISPREGLALLQGAPLLELAGLANDVRYRKNTGSVVTFVVDTNPNYTNVCIRECSFCAFYRKADAPDAYVRPVDELIESFRAAAMAGVSTVLLQGGVNPELPLSYYLELVRRTVAEVPAIHPHFFSPPEIMGMAESSGRTVAEVLTLLWEAGLRTLPGGGAEILSERVKSQVSPRKGSAADWLEVMRTAHRLGFKTTATMMFGHLETGEDVITHLEAIRTLQDEYGGFTAFIPWSFKPANSPLGERTGRGPQAIAYLRLIALARIYLDNFPHIQASPFSEGKKIGQVALHFGADDFGGTLLEENVHRAADYVNPGGREESIALIQSAGFDAAQRDTGYRILHSFPRNADCGRSHQEDIDYQGLRC